MKIYTYEELQNYIALELSKPYNYQLVYCYSRQQSDKSLHSFIKINNDIRYEVPWHDGPQYLKAGDYLHANTLDIYGITAAMFAQCYQIVDINHNVAP